MRVAVVPEVLVGLVGDDDEVALDREVGDRLQLLRREDDPGRVVRGVEQQQPRAVGHGGAQRIDIGPERRWPQRHAHAGGIGQRDAHGVDVEPRLEDDDLVAGVAQGEQRRLDRLGGTGRHHDVGRGIDGQAVEALLVLGDRGAQVGQPVHGRVLVAPALGDRRARDHLDLVGAVRVGEALAEIDRPRLGRDGRHLAEDGGRVGLHPRHEGALHVSPSAG